MPRADSTAHRLGPVSYGAANRATTQEPASKPGRVLPFEPRPSQPVPSLTDAVRQQLAGAVGQSGAPLVDPIHALRALIQAEVQLALRTLGPVPPATATKLKRGANALLLSKREAARRLGIDRNEALPALIANGQLKVVQKNGSVAVPAAEVERLVREGFDTAELRPTKRRARVSPVRRGTTTALPTAVSGWKLKP